MTRDDRGMTRDDTGSDVNKIEMRLLRTPRFVSSQRGLELATKCLVCEQWSPRPSLNSAIL